MLLEAQGKLQAESQTPRSTSSVAVGTGETVRTSGDRVETHTVAVILSSSSFCIPGDSLFWGVPDQLVEQAPPPSTPSTPPFSSSASSGRAPSHADLSVQAEEEDASGQGAMPAFTSQQR